jgi:hypothetical protein
MLEMLTVILAAPLIAATAYVHHRLPIHTRHTGRTWMLRALLILVGIGLGWLGALWFAQATIAMRWAAFLFGFGLAHVPSFFILYMKRQRGEYGHG